MVESFISTLPIPVVLFTADAPLKPKYSHKGSIPVQSFGFVIVKYKVRFPYYVQTVPSTIPAANLAAVH